jgi:hypothetical protein
MNDIDKIVDHTEHMLMLLVKQGHSNAILFFPFENLILRGLAPTHSYFIVDGKLCPT